MRYRLLVPRKPRIEFEGAVYHVIARGNRRLDIFHEDGDRIRYLGLIESYKARFSFRLYGYALMRNHVHLVLETGPAPLSRIMQGINQSYTQYYNRKYEKVGHLFQGRYKAILCDADAYLAALIRYVHLNPVRAGIVKVPEDYRWTGHRSYITARKDSLLDEETVLGMFSQRKGLARRLYREFVEASLGDGHDAMFYGAGGAPVIGDEEFEASIAKRVKRVEADHAGAPPASLDTVAAIAGEVAGVAVDEIRGRIRSAPLARARHIFMVAAVELGHRRAEIARYLGHDPTSISRRMTEAGRVRAEVRQVLGTIKEKQGDVS